jgi:hypothetical protein
VKDADLLLHYTGAAWAQYMAAQALSLSATDKILGRVSSGAGAAEEVAFTDQAQQLCDDTSFGAMRTTLGAPGLGDANVFTANNRINANLGIGVDPTYAIDIYGTTANSTRINLSRTSGGATLFAVNGGGGGFSANLGPFQIYTNNGSGDNLQAQFGHSTQGMILGAPTGSFKGVGTLNAQAVYDDNTLLTCGPLELMTSGKVDLDKWDALTPNREHPAEYEDVYEEREGEQVLVGQRLVREAYVEERRHEVMHRFAAMVEEGFDPRDPANFCARMRTDGAVPGLITETEWRGLLDRGEKLDAGTMLTRTFLALDNLAVAFANVVERVETLEGQRDAAG